MNGLIKFMQGGKEVDKIDFDKTEKGESKEIKIEMYNAYNDIVELTNPYSVDPEVKIVEYTRTMGIKSFGKLILKFTPSMERTESLKLKDIGFKVVIG